MQPAEHISSWPDFEARLSTLFAERERRHKAAAPFHISDLRFRGHAKAAWRLETTLERYAERFEKKELLRLNSYYRRIRAAKPEIESFTDRQWNIENWRDYQARVAKGGPVSNWVEGETYPYMVFLRHHGFPSPLLDWSRSPYVAAYFAFANAKPEDENVAIFAFLEWAEKGGKTGSSSLPEITGLGPYVSAHKRHFIQQSEYTVCTTTDKDGSVYSSHEDAIAKSEPGQDILWKFALPTALRIDILRILDSHNINALSLFGSDEGLMETAAFRELVLRD